jgi:hypothetical protein
MWIERLLEPQMHTDEHRYDDKIVVAKERKAHKKTEPLSADLPHGWRARDRGGTIAVERRSDVMRKPVTTEFKDEACKLVMERGYSINGAARELGIAENTLSTGSRSVATRQFPLSETLTPFAHQQPVGLEFLGDDPILLPRGSRQHDLRPQHLTRRRTSPACPPFKGTPIFIRQYNLGSHTHALILLSMDKTRNSIIR